MIHPSRIDGEPLRVVTLPDGRVFVDAEPERIIHGNAMQLNRGGPEHSRHFHRFMGYGLTDGLLRCAKCGLAVPPGTVNFDSGKETNG